MVEFLNSTKHGIINENNIDSPGPIIADAMSKNKVWDSRFIV